MKNTVTNILLAIFSILICFVLLEAGARIYTGDFAVRNVLKDYTRLLMAAYPTQYDDHLGWIPKEGVSVHNASGARITILENGIRANGTSRDAEVQSGERPIVAVGDSFTFGYEVADNETWPSILEDLLDRKVINGGVFAYGMDQSFLRAKQLIEIYNPDTLIFSFIPDDIWRNQISARSGINKPYFAVHNESLVLMNSPVPRPTLSDHGDPGIRRILGYSVFIHTVIMRSPYAMWWLRGDKWEDKQVNSDEIGEKVACLIVRDLDDMARSKNLKIFLLAQYGRNWKSTRAQRSRRVLACAKPEFLTVVDLHKPLVDVWIQDKHKYRSLFTEQQHMTYSGNKFVAMKLQEAISQQEAGIQ